MNRILLLTMLCCGCASTVSGARTTLAVVARATVAADEEIAPKYADAAKAALAESTTRVDYAVRMKPWDAVAAGLDAVRSALIATDIAVDSWDSEGDEMAFASASACLVIAINELVTAYEIVDTSGLDWPMQAVQALANYGGHCDR